jgi:hypothetical protein
LKIDDKNAGARNTSLQDSTALLTTTKVRLHGQKANSKLHTHRIKHFVSKTKDAPIFVIAAMIKLVER